ncbi:MAG TPA: hypothetical protein VGN95_08995 [Pyrinomonadaceae bacterium]|nr:hypothetical protein [Pyrinomonadaceae bacterium]
MNYRQTISIKKVLVAFTLATIVVVAGITLKSVLAQSRDQASQKNVHFQVEWLKRKAVIDKQQEATATPTVTIRLSGLQATDYVNIRPTKNSVIEATAGAIPAPSVMASKSSEQLPESTLEVTQSEITFTRPSSTGNPILLDIQIPSGTQTKIITDDNLVLSASLQEGEPLSLRGQQIGQGVSTISEAMAQVMIPSMLPSSLKGKPLGQFNENFVRPFGNSGRYLVPFSRLQVVKKVPVEGTPTQIIARLEIDETGHVEKVQPISSTPASGLEETLKQWEFAPFQVDGHPVRVITQFTPADQ